MCGIAGIYNLDGRPADVLVTARMVEAIGYRGPDARGSCVLGPVALAHTRLSILDVERGQQPMSNDDGSLWITFNGEIFNYVELRAQLMEKGYRFRTGSDTEVLLRLYEEMGEKCVTALNGQWAFALWDDRRHTLFLSRDRLGVRPLFHTTVGNCFLFGSEVKALFAHPNVPRDIDRRALDQIFTIWTTVAPRTIFQGISELPPGHSMSIADSGHRLYAHWHPSQETRTTPIDAGECAHELFDLLVDATRIRLRSDVPVGTYLSGGLDSTVISAIVKRLANEPPRTFSVGFEDPEFDESAYQDEAIASLQSIHTRVQCSRSDIARVFPDVIWHTETPVLRTAPAPFYLLAGAVRENGYKVVVTGEGADEMLGGYDIFKEAKIRAFWARRPDSSMRPMLLRRLYPYLDNVQAQSDDYLRAFFRVDRQPSNCFFSHLPRWQLTSRLKTLFSHDVKSELASYDVYEDLKASLPAGFEKWDWFARAQHLEAATLLPGYILSSQGDRMAMAHGVEGRFPFLDHRVVEFARSLPPHLKMKVLNEKYILKKAAGHMVPMSIRRRTKQPYRAPEIKSFFSADGTVPEYVEALLAEDRIRQDGIFNPAAVRHLLTKARAGSAISSKDNMGFVGVLSTQLLIDRFLR